MSKRQREYFREKLLSWRDDVVNEAKRPLQPLREEQSQSDIIDRASSEADRELDLRARERQPFTESRVATQRSPVKNRKRLWRECSCRNEVPRLTLKIQAEQG